MTRKPRLRKEAAAGGDKRLQQRVVAPEGVTADGRFGSVQGDTTGRSERARRTRRRADKVNRGSALATAWNSATTKRVVRSVSPRTAGAGRGLRIRSPRGRGQILLAARYMRRRSRHRPVRARWRASRRVPLRRNESARGRDTSLSLRSTTRMPPASGSPLRITAP